MTVKIESGFDYADGRHIPTVKIILEPCGADDNSAWEARDVLAKQILNIDDAQSELAALREELAERKRKHLRSCQIAIGKSQLAKERHAALIIRDRELEIAAEHADDLQLRLTAADQRNSKYESMLRHFASCADVRQVGTLAMEFVADLAKPTESGASE